MLQIFDLANAGHLLELIEKTPRRALALELYLEKRRLVATL